MQKTTVTDAARYIDLHIHTNYSDGTLSPHQVVVYAIQQHLSAIAITDHDSVDAIPHCIAAAQDTTLEIIPGVELSADDEQREIHIIGLLLDWQSPRLRERLSAMRAARLERVREMVSRLNRRGVAITAEDVFALSSQQGTVGRLHVARALLGLGVVSSVAEAFARFLGSKGPCYVPHPSLSPRDAIALIRSAQGIPILAHPGTSQCDELIAQFVADGLRGIEIVHSEHSPHAQQYYTNVARAHQLLLSGGSDCHGDGKGLPRMGTVRIPYEYLVQMRAAKEPVCGAGT